MLAKPRLRNIVERGERTRRLICDASEITNTELAIPVAKVITTNIKNLDGSSKVVPIELVNTRGNKIII